MINNRERAQIYYTEGVTYLRPESEGVVLTVGNAMYVSASNVDDATVTFEQSSSIEGDSYIKINIASSTSQDTTHGCNAANYLFWDTGFLGYHTPSICLTMDCSGALESDLVTSANSGLPVVVMGYVWAPDGAVPQMTGKAGTDSSGDVINTWLAMRMGNGSDASIESDLDHGNSTFSFSSANASRGGASGCRGFRSKVETNVLIMANNGAPETRVAYHSSLVNTPGTNCDGNNIQQKTKNDNDDIPINHRLFVFVGAGNTATGGDDSTFAGIFKMRIK
tara:strand:+ start:119 stop:955 length:837 start_codon:yes stop_codon:yes gene_type:complete